MKLIGEQAVLPGMCLDGYDIPQSPAWGMNGSDSEVEMLVVDEPQVRLLDFVAFKLRMALTEQNTWVTK